ncbi:MULTISPECIES: DoxX-like family protein [Paenibacillus]|uniref:DoxX-like family protein n=1 Tax=Paenibacillus TaxID=44249 RepID=UPI0022B8F609|nr:DoxX-like family protein [Paenibacillus caseinilyticus]MCZ8521985.1 DoxX-like family protein [Paenibacillus caseinilyticus]
MRRKPIYVELTIDTAMQALWKHTQTPELHEQWDLRFSEIRYLPKKDESDPQRFLYRTRIGFGLSIAGEGETAGTTEKNGVRTSVLAFSSDQPISLIREGAGFWRYEPDGERVRFLTRYDYRTRFGRWGTAADALVFRPLMGWATAWSFDCLRLWLEKGIPPRLSVTRMLTHGLCLTVLALDWMYQGLVPKLLYPDAGELEILRGTGWFAGSEEAVIRLLGAAEIAFGLGIAAAGIKYGRWVYGLNLILLVLLGLSAAAGDAGTYAEPFNPVTLNLSMMGIAVAGILQLRDLPEAGRCRRKPIGKEEEL